MRYLLIDQGNTRCKLTTQADGVWGELEIVPECTVEVLLDWQQRMGEDFASMAVVYSSVGRRENSALLQFLSEAFAYALALDADTPLPLNNVLYDRAQIGVDRLAVAVAVHSVLPSQYKGALIIDIGTAITIDTVWANGTFVGGNISPGPVARLEALHRATSRLPLVALPQSWDLCGHTTEEAIRAGVMQGIVYELQGYIDAQDADIAIFLTGGIASNFATQLKNVTFVFQNLLMEGLNRILEFNVHNNQ